MSFVNSTQRLMKNKICRTVGKNSFSRSFATILATDGVDDLCVKIFQDRGHQVDLLPTLPPEELNKIISKYDGLVVRSATKVTPELLCHATKLKIVGRAGVGIDNINVSEATKYGVLVMNTPDGNTVSTAQLTMSLLTSMARHIPAANMSVKEDKWDRKSLTGVELGGKTLGIIGCGRIGQVVASCAKGLGMKVIGFDPVMSKEAFAATGITRVERVEDIYPVADFITVHTPLTPATNNLINDESLALCKKGVRIVNCARGGIVDEIALLRALNSGQVAGAALDVFTSEPPREHLQPLLRHPAVVCTPHLGASTEEAQLNVARDIAEQMCDVLDGKDFVGIVNVPYMSAASQVHMKPFMKLAEIIGSMIGQMNTSSPVKEVVVQTYGGRDVSITTPQARQLLRAKVLTGLLRHHKKDKSKTELEPDFVSSPSMAKDLGLVSTVSLEQSALAKGSQSRGASPYWNMISVTATSEDGVKSVLSGVVFGSVPHIVQVDDYVDYAFRPESGQILTFRNSDRPGVISQVLGLLADAGINVASFNNARLKKDDTALCFLDLDQPVSPKVLESIKSLPFLSHVASIQLK